MLQKQRYFVFHAYFFLVKIWRLDYPQCNSTFNSLGNINIADIYILFHIFYFIYILLDEIQGGIDEVHLICEAVASQYLY